MLTAHQSRLIKGAPADASRTGAAFLRLADAIQRRDECSRVEALQRAVDEHPISFEEYCRAFGR